MGSKYSTILLLITAFLSGFVLMSMELVYPRISIIWFGNVLAVWAIDLSMSLVAIAIGYWAGSRLLIRKKREITYYLLLIYLTTAAYLVLINFTHQVVLEKISSLDVTFGSIVFSILFMFPTIGLLAISGPLLVHLKNTISPKNAFSSSVIFGVSTLGGALAMLIIGLYTLPHLGIRITIYCLVTLLVTNGVFILMYKLKK
jgi:hypothetical protein